MIPLGAIILRESQKVEDDHYAKLYTLFKSFVFFGGGYIFKLAIVVLLSPQTSSFWSKLNQNKPNQPRFLQRSNPAFAV
ncbi:hypothetical protein FPOAC1_000437 [Fusarium poae]|uniref:hypothetical protein n=1 Tax=Fusarium poae TaxID=36050 RepID=UPI001CEBF7D6|nr:hypothetical protein FPOAC1_000437 [Fusarium poae]KAG8674469.1 hypothetical protein FPOAC1_000437 [Fusarium poae]